MITSDAEQQHDRRVGLWIFLLFAAVYSLTYKGIGILGDSFTPFLMAEGLLHGMLGYDVSSFPPEQQALIAHALTGGMRYVFGLGWIFLVLPFVVLGHLIALAFPAYYKLYIVLFVGGFFGVLCAAAAQVVFFKVCRQLKYSCRTSLWLTLAFGFGTFFWDSARGVSIEGVLAWLFLLNFLLLLRYGAAPSRKTAMLAGCCVAAALLCKIYAVAFVPAFVGYMYWQSRGRTKDLLLYTGVALAGLCLHACFHMWNQRSMTALFGYPMQTMQISYIRWFEVIYGYLFSAGNSILLYAPPLWASLIALNRFQKNHRAIAVMAGALFVLAIVLHSQNPGWYGGGFGPRHLIPVLPFLMLPAGLLLESAWRTPTKRRIVYALFAWSVLFQMPSHIYGAGKIFAMARESSIPEPIVVMSPYLSPVVSGVRLLGIGARYFTATEPAPPTFAWKRYSDDQGAAQYVMTPRFLLPDLWIGRVLGLHVLGRADFGRGFVATLPIRTQEVVIACVLCGGLLTLAGWAIAQLLRLSRTPHDDSALQ